MSRLRRALEEVASGTALAAALASRLDSLAETRIFESDLLPSPAALPGLARLFAADAESARFVANRPSLFARLARGGLPQLRERRAALESGARFDPELPLEDALDELRLARREESSAVACLDLAGQIPFEEASLHLSLLAESIVVRALALAQRGREEVPIVVLGMGKIAGREFTYHSDLDLIFLYAGGPDRVVAASRVGQRLIAYLTTMTGAGVAYPVDARLRPSGQQGMLVTAIDRFEAYQCEQAETWEHVALLRGRAIACVAAPGAEVLARVHAAITSRRHKPWRYLADLRERVERERAAEIGPERAFKTGPGGLMDVDFLAAGAQLERGRSAPIPLPSAPNLLAAAVAGERVERVLRNYGFLRRVEARARLVAGRGVEGLPADPAALELVAELVEPGLSGAALLARQAALRAELRGAWQRVIAADSIAALEE